MKTIIEFGYPQMTGTIWSDDIYVIPRLRTLFERYPENVRINYDETDEGGGIEIELPKKWIKIPTYHPKGHHFTPEEVERAKISREKSRKSLDKQTKV